MRTKLIALAAFSTLLLASCKKDNKDAETKTETLTKSSWKFDTYGVDVDGDLKLTGAEIEIRDCDQDDVMTFSANGTATFNLGADNCGAAVSSFQSTWTFYDNETAFSYKGDKMRIIALTDTKLELHSGGPVSTYIVILKK
jgi:hypothetical protein